MPIPERGGNEAPSEAAATAQSRFPPSRTMRLFGFRKVDFPAAFDERSAMFQGQLIAILIAGRKGDDLHAIEKVEAVAGHGLVGDRYFAKEGTFSDKEGPEREVTLIEAEALDGLAREYDITLQPAQARRNLLTRGVPLNHLVGKTFTVGNVVLRGIKLCEPCGHLQKLTCKGVEKGLKHRGGLRAQIVAGGVMEVGAAIAMQPW
jgi:MOSC domain-containing protein YiiM